MAATIKQFAYEITKMKSDNQVVFDPMVLLVLDHWGTTKKGGAPTLSANLMSADEIDEHVENLKADLDSVAVNEKRALQKAKTETMAIVSARIDARNS